MSTNRFRIGALRGERSAPLALRKREGGGGEKPNKQQNAIPWEDSASVCHVAGVQAPDSYFSKYTRRVFTSCLCCAPAPGAPPRLCTRVQQQRRRDGETESPFPLLREHTSDVKYVHNGRVKDICHAQRRRERQTDEKLLFSAACSCLRRPDGMAETHPSFFPFRRGQGKPSRGHSCVCDKLWQKEVGGGRPRRGRIRRIQSKRRKEGEGRVTERDSEAAGEGGEGRGREGGIGKKTGSPA